jgi:hypothetical protein
MLSGELDSVAEREAEHEAEHMAERESDATYYPETFQPEERRLDSGDYAELFFDCMDYRKAHLLLAQRYCASFDHLASDEIGFPLGLRYESLDSPRFYNFGTDHLFAFISEETIGRLFDLSAAEYHSRLATMIAERFTSYNGFASGYPNDLDSWLAKPLADWDHNELGTLLIALLPTKIQRDVEDNMGKSEDFQDAFEAAMDWPKFEAAVERKRPGYMPPPSPCPGTGNLFPCG